jgi:hypothetical protein
MSDDHVFIDTAGHSIAGKRACLYAWREFFASFPGYRNTFESIHVVYDVVTIAAYSVCPGYPDLEGPALWTAVIVRGRVSQWHVHDDTPQARRRLGIR